MPDQEWVKTLEDGRKVKFIYQELPEDGAFLTAQVGGNEVVYSVVLTKAKNPLSHEDVEGILAASFQRGSTTHLGAQDRVRTRSLRRHFQEACAICEPDTSENQIELKPAFEVLEVESGSMEASG